ncbi:hypothetical protein C1H46_019015 [Malus baccata]|uniref:Uncharacterized protein n=1 Tax=Malus baccata TaxID=106549 RepID=A0A540M9E4_MALBA|nr:hypothetical protein C1H46_019015 [Malus baccata]
MSLEALQAGKDVKGEPFGRGTKVTLFLKEDQLDFLEERKLNELVKKHSEFISYLIYLWTKKTVEKEISDDEGEDEEGEEKKEDEGKVDEDDTKLVDDIDVPLAKENKIEESQMEEVD